MTKQHFLSLLNTKCRKQWPSLTRWKLLHITPQIHSEILQALGFLEFKKNQNKRTTGSQVFSKSSKNFFSFFYFFIFLIQRTDRELAVIEAIIWFFPIFWEPWLHTSESQYFDILRTVMKNPKDHSDNHWGSVCVYDNYPTM